MYVHRYIYKHIRSCTSTYIHTYVRMYVCRSTSSNIHYTHTLIHRTDQSAVYIVRIYVVLSDVSGVTILLYPVELTMSRHNTSHHVTSL